MKTNAKVLLVVFSFIFAISGCTPKDSDDDNAKADAAYTEFFTSTQKIQSNLFLTDENIKSVFEGYIDSNGNGQGLIEVGDVVREVYISNNKLIIEVLGKTYSASDIGPFFSFISFEDENLQKDNIHISGDKISSVSGSYNGVTYTTKYEESEEVFTQEVFTIDSEITFKDLLILLSTVNSEKSDKSDAIGALLNPEEEPVIDEEQAPLEEKEPSFYLNSDLGITIGDKTYSIGDKINHDDYYNNMVPEGLSYDYVWDSINKLETKTTSYLDTTGKLTVVSIDDIVFELSATADFKFLGLYKGMDQQELRQLLGIGLNKKELETFEPIYPGLEVVKAESKTIKCTVGSLTIEFGIKDKKLNSIYLSEDRGYLHYDS